MLNINMRVIYLIIALILISGCATSPYTNAPMPEHVDTAMEYIGKHERRNRKELRALLGIDPVRTEWCAAFVNNVLESNEIKGSSYYHENPLMARSFLDWGEPVDDPQPGDIVVFPRGNSGWQGHVGFYIATHERDGVEYYLILGGNQDNQVNLSYFRSSTALGIRRQAKVITLTWQQKITKKVLDNIG